MAISTTQRDSIIELYTAYFNRASDATGLAFWVSSFETYWNANTSTTKTNNEFALESIVNDMATSTEYKALYPASQTNDEFITAIYTNLLGRAPDAEGLAFWSGHLAAGTMTSAEAITQMIAGAKANTTTQGIADAALIANKTAVSEYFALTLMSDDITVAGTAFDGVTDDATTVDTAKATLDGSAGTNSGSTFTLTAATDNISGTANDDTIIGDIGTSGSGATVNAADQINGGAGTDTYKIFSSFTAGTSATGTITNTENLFIDLAAAADQNFSSLTLASTGIANIEMGNVAALTANTITTTTGQSLSLSTGSAGSATAGAVTWAASAADTSLSLALNGYQGGTGVTPVALTVTGALATTLNIASTGAANKVGTHATTYFTGPTSVTSHVITGDQALTYVLAAADSGALSSIDASANTGGVSANVAAGTAKAAFTFTGGTGNDAIILADNNLGTLTAGSQLDGGAGTADKLGIYDTALTTAELAAINAATNFEVLGLNANITLDGTALTSVSSFAIDTAGLTDTISNMATGAV